MSAGELVVVAVRLLVPLLILRHPLVGGLAAVVADTTDVVLIELIGLGGFGDHYSQLDKGLDTYYMSLELWVSLGWSAWAKWPAVLLFVYRIAGVALFESTGTRWLLLVFPNLFENWWLYCVVVERYFASVYPRSLQTVAIPMALLLIPKLGQEYMLHFAKVQPWDWTKRHLIGIE